ncbi:MAG: hypothetical protein V1695_01770 [Candidatus Uhrbacteria bacterium]
MSGSGTDSDKNEKGFETDYVDCGHEGGLGRVERLMPVDPIDEDALVQIGDPGAKICTNCRGSGDVDYIAGLGKSWHTCPTCGGSGAV